MANYVKNNTKKNVKINGIKKHKLISNYVKV